VTDRPGDQPLHLWASTDVLAAVIDAEMAVFLGRAPAKDDTLRALAARRELEDRMRRHRWLALETARKAGATWAEIGSAAGMKPADACLLYERTVAGKKAFGPAEPGHHAPGGPEL
jgi:hypothetical protein